MVTLSTSYLTTTNEHCIDISQNRQDISQNLSKINDISNKKIPALESDISDTGNSFEEIVGEFNNMANIYRYDNLTNTAGEYQDPIGGYRLSRNGNLKVKGDLCFCKKSTTDSYCFQDLMFIKSLETNTLQLSATKKLEFKLNNTGGITNNTDEIYVKLSEITNDKE
jgi:hypothetical protein